MTFDEIAVTLGDVTDDSISALRARRDAAHDAYSAAYHDREDREQELQQLLIKRTALAARRASAAELLKTKTQEAFKAAIEDQGEFDKNSAYVIGARAVIGLIDQCLAYIDSFSHADARRAVLGGTVRELELLYAHELLRRDCHAAETMSLLSKATEHAGELEINGLGSVSEAIEEVVAQVWREISSARGALVSHDADIRIVRDKYYKEYGNV